VGRITVWRQLFLPADDNHNFRLLWLG
jgi:hypothetical protein